MNIDYQRIEYMRGLLDTDFIPELTSFLSNAQGYIDDMNIVLHQKNYMEFAALAHKLRSISAQLGLKDIEDLCAILEYGQSMEEGKLFALYGNLAAALNSVEHEFQARYLNPEHLD